MIERVARAVRREELVELARRFGTSCHIEKASRHLMVTSAATGDATTGDAATGDAATGDAATGDAATGDAATGDAATGDAKDGT